jgi:16S rRNA (adenine1518-N6/adenine1519-N6)-dimethyltransferase
MYTLKKSLGQHFLKDENISRKIVEELTQSSFNRLVEVGPGGGALTKYLVAIPGIDFIAVEVDAEKVEYLEKTFPFLKGKIIHKSFLEIDKPFEDSFCIIGNFPYNISTQIVFKILDWAGSVDCVIGMFQKEVAMRFAAREGNKVYGVTSVLVQAFFKVEYLFDVSETAFNPPPKIKSGVIRLLPLPSPVEVRSKEKFYLLVKTAFGQRRKTLRNACRGIFEPAVLEKAIFDLRAEQLTVQQFAQLSFEMK